jgi:hypothetical protein
MWRKFRTLALIVGLVVVAGAPRAVAAEDPTLDRFDLLLQRFVAPGGVRYDAWRASPEDLRALSEVVAELAASRPSELSPDQRHALYINLYNAKMLELVLTGDPDIESVRDLARGITGFGIFFKDVLEFDGKRRSLNGLEDRLRRESRDPRIHFAVNCASRSCPPLRDEAYRVERLDAQLDEATRAFLALPGELVELETGKGPRLQVSKIFKWYAKDFEPAGGVLEFILAHAPDDVAARLAKHGDRLRLKYVDYDWSLNRAP